MRKRIFDKAIDLSKIQQGIDKNIGWLAEFEDTFMNFEDRIFFIQAEINHYINEQIYITTLSNLDKGKEG